MYTGRKITHLSSQKVHGECKGSVSISLLLEMPPKSLSLMWMLCSSRPGGLADVLSCNVAATGTAIASSENRMAPLNNKIKKQAVVWCRCFYQSSFVYMFWYIGLLGQINPRSAADSQVASPVCAVTTTEKKQKNDDARWQPAAPTAH